MMGLISCDDHKTPAVLPPLGNSKTFYFTLHNETAYPFTLYANDSPVGTAPANGKYVYESDEEGTYIFKAKQITGYFEYPCVKTWNSAYFSAGDSKSGTIENNQTATIKLVNNANNRYNIFVNGESKGNIAGNSEISYTVDAWKTYEVRAVQVDGYTFYPSEHEYTINAEANYMYTRTFNNLK